MSRTVNSDGLSDIFDIEPDANFFENDITEDLTDEEIIENIDDNVKDLPELNSEPIDPDSEYINTNLKDMITDVKDIISAAKYLINSSPDENTITAASTLFSSAVGLLKELNKGVLQSRKERHTMAIEKLKISARHELAVFKNKSNPLNAIGSGNTINIDNRQQQISFSQEDLVKQIIKANNETKNLTDGHD